MRWFQERNTNTVVLKIYYPVFKYNYVWLKLPLKCDKATIKPLQSHANSPYKEFSSRLTYYIVEFTRVGMNRRLSKASRDAGERREWLPSEGKSLETHQTRSGPGHFGGAGRSRERRLDISRDAGSPLPKLDTFLRLCVKPSPAFHIHFTQNLISSPSTKIERLKMWCLDNLCTFFSWSYKAHHNPLDEIMWESGRKLSPFLLVSVSFLLAGAQHTFPLSISVFNWVQSFLQTSLERPQEPHGSD